jgi:hypothetical protein
MVSTKDPLHATVVHIDNISKILDISLKFCGGRYFLRKILRNFRHFEYVATLSLTHEILRKCRELMESVDLLGKSMEKLRVKGVLEATGCLF